MARDRGVSQKVVKALIPLTYHPKRTTDLNNEECSLGQYRVGGFVNTGGACVLWDCANRRTASFTKRVGSSALARTG